MYPVWGGQTFGYPRTELRVTPLNLQSFPVLTMIWCEIAVLQKFDILNVTFTNKVFHT